MRLTEIRLERQPGRVRLVGCLEGGGGPASEIFYGFPGELEHLIATTADAFLPALLIPSMKTGEDLEFAQPVSERLLAGADRAQEILAAWHPSTLRRVRVRATPRSAAGAAPAPGCASLFSGGVDSIFTVHRSEAADAEIPRVTHLLFMSGLEQPLSRTRGDSAVLERIRRSSWGDGRQLVAGETNLRERFTLNYELYYHGAALAGASLALAEGIGTVLFPSTYTYAQSQPWGSHPLLDPLWSTEKTTFIHHGAGTSRVEKIAALVRERPEALADVRVCLENAGGDFNCGRCKKCIRTMVALELLGALDRAPSFPPRLPRETANVLRLEQEDFLAELCEYARRAGGHGDLSRILDGALAARRRREALRQFARNTPLLSGLLERVDAARMRRRARRRAAR